MVIEILNFVSVIEEILADDFIVRPDLIYFIDVFRLFGATIESRFIFVWPMRFLGSVPKTEGLVSLAVLEKSFEILSVIN